MCTAPKLPLTRPRCWIQRPASPTVTVDGHLYDCSMDVVGVAIAGVSAVVALISAVVAWRARGDSNRSATAAEMAEHRASRPRLLIEPEGDVPRDATDVIYRVHNLQGPDLVSVIIHRPAIGPTDGGSVSYRVAATGRGDFADRVEIGPIPIAQYRCFTFKIGSRDQLPEFRVKITCSAVDGTPWQIGETLTTPRGPAQLQAERELQQRGVEEQQAFERQALEEARGVSYNLRGGAGMGTASPQWEMTTLHIAVRNDSELTASELHLVVGDDEFVWSSAEPVTPGQQMDVQADLNGALPDAPQSEAGGKSFHSYPSRLAFVLGGRRYARSGDAAPEPVSAEPG